MNAVQEKPLTDPATPPEAGSAPATTTRLPPPGVAREFGGRDGPEPTRYGDWEKAGRCIDF